MRPLVPVISGEGRPRILVEYDDPIYQSSGSVSYTDSSAEESAGSSKTIDNVISADGQATFHTTTPHGLLAGQWIRIAGNTSTPSFNGDYQIALVTDASHLVIDKTATSDVGDGTITKIVDPEILGLRTGMLIKATSQVPPCAST